MAITGFISQLAVDMVLNKSANKARSIKREWGLFAVSIGCVFAGLIFFAMAGYMALAAVYTEPAAALLTGLIIWIIAAAIFFISRRVSRKQQQALDIEKEQISGYVTNILDEVLDDAENPIRKSPLTSVLVAGLAGYFAGDRFH